MSTITFIGAGNMARAMSAGLIAAGQDPTMLRAGDPDTAARSRLAELGMTTSAANPELLVGADAVVLAIKPQIFTRVVAPLAEHLEPDTLVISIVAGIPITTIEHNLSAVQPIVRCMPNTPALLGKGITGMYANAAVTVDQQSLAQEIAGAIGRWAWVDSEANLDAVTAVSGSGPAYFFYLMEAMIEAGIELGLSPDLARELTVATAAGAAAMANVEGADPAVLRHNVTSIGGTTERALSIFNDHNINRHLREALKGAAQRSVELAQEFGTAK
jgi:pyrroline-5-carboxylate reductase